MSLKEEVIYCSYCHLPNHISSRKCSHCGQSLKKDILKLRVNSMLKYFLFLFISLYITLYLSQPLLSPYFYSLLFTSLNILKFSAIYLILIDTFVDPNLWRMNLSKVFRNRYMNTSFVIFISNLIRWVTHGSIQLEEKVYDAFQNKILKSPKIKRIITKRDVKIYFPDNFEWVC